MNSPDILAFLWELGLILVAATILSAITRRLKQPPLVGYIIAGILIGPYFLNFLAEKTGLNISFLPRVDITNIAMLSQLGVAFLLFSVGIDSDLFKLKKVGKVAIIGGFLQVTLTVLLTLLLGRIFAFLGFLEALYLAVILSCSSTMLILKLLSDSFAINTLHGRLVTGISLVQDALIVLFIPVLLDFSLISNIAVFLRFILSGAYLLGLALFLNRYLYPKIFSKSTLNPELLFLGPLSICFAFMFISESLGITIAMGAFIAGLSLSALPYSFEISNETRGVRDFFVTIFFVTLGMQLNLFYIPTGLSIVLLSLAVILIIKPLITYIICLFAGYGHQISLAAALILIPVSEYSFLLASQGYSHGLLSTSFYSATIFVIGISMIITPYFFKYKDELAEAFAKFSGKMPSFGGEFFRRNIKRFDEPQSLSSNIVIVGGGVMGGSAARFLHREKPIVIDHDPDVIDALKKEGFEAIYGDAENKLIWKRINFADVKVLILAIPKFDAVISVLRYAKKVNPNIVVFARAHSFHEAKELYNANADFVCMPEAVGSNIIVKEVAEYLHSGSLARIRALHTELMHYLEETSKKHEKHHFKQRNNLV